MRHSGQALRHTVVRLTAAFLFALVGLPAFEKVSGAQTVINTVQDLQSINNNLSGSYVLGGDIDAAVTATWNGGSGFVPIGKNGTPFVGTFDGQGHVIDNLTSSSTIFYSGLFGDVGPSGIVRNVGVTNANIRTGLISGHGGGVLVGQNEGTVDTSYGTGAIDGGTYGSNVGGLVGSNLGLITRSYASVIITGQGIYSYGGLVGDNYASGTISQSYATGLVSGTAQNKGGLAALNFGTVTSSYWDVQTTGQTTSAGGTGLTTAQLQSGTLPSGFDPTVWVASQGQYPQLLWKISAHDQFVSSFNSLTINYISPSPSVSQQAFIANQKLELSSADNALSASASIGQPTHINTRLGGDAVSWVQWIYKAVLTADGITTESTFPFPLILLCSTNAPCTVPVSNDKIINASSYDLFNFDVLVRVNDTSLLPLFSIGDRYILNFSITGDLGLPGFSEVEVAGISGTTVELTGHNLNEIPGFSGQPGQANCIGKSVSALAVKYKGLAAAALALSYKNVDDLRRAISAYCEA